MRWDRGRARGSKISPPSILSTYSPQRTRGPRSSLFRSVRHSRIIENAISSFHFLTFPPAILLSVISVSCDFLWVGLRALSLIHCDFVSARIIRNMN